MPEKQWILAQDANRFPLRSTLRWGAGLLTAMGSISVVGALSTMPDLAPADRRQVVEALTSGLRAPYRRATSLSFGRSRSERAIRFALSFRGWAQAAKRLGRTY